MSSCEIVEARDLSKRKQLRGTELIKAEGEELMKHIIDFFKKNHIISIKLALKPNIEKVAKILFTKLGFKESVRIYELEL